LPRRWARTEEERRKVLREAIFEGLKGYATADAPAGFDKKKVKKERLRK
jgi:hypothetical protein